MKTNYNKNVLDEYYDITVDGIFTQKEEKRLFRLISASYYVRGLALNTLESYVFSKEIRELTTSIDCSNRIVFALASDMSEDYITVVGAKKAALERRRATTFPSREEYVRFIGEKDDAKNKYILRTMFFYAVGDENSALEAIERDFSYNDYYAVKLYAALCYKLNNKGKELYALTILGLICEKLRYESLPACYVTRIKALVKSGLGNIRTEALKTDVKYADLGKEKVRSVGFRIEEVNYNN